MFLKKIIIPVLIIGILSTTAIFLTPLETKAYLGDRVLTWGTRGYDVKQLQKDLNYLGYSAGQVDGIYGWQTTQAVKNFQRNNGLAVDGIAGRQTAMAVIRQVSQPVGTSTPSRGILSCSNQDIENLARLVHGEARGESFEGQVAVAAVVLNRIASGQFGQTIGEVIFQPGAFTAVSDGQFYQKPNSSSYQAAQAALRGWDPTGNALYYWNPVTATSKWVWTRQIITKIGRHVFAR